MTNAIGVQGFLCSCSDGASDGVARLEQPQSLSANNGDLHAWIE